VNSVDPVNGLVHNREKACGKLVEMGFTPVFLCKRAQGFETKEVRKSLLQESEARVRKLLKTKER
jgi:hypothetical protein